ncbi:hypothetical protein [Ralstonia sp. UBA689]|uniref:hypothetical protein n=1 Tax=Ralstonia sp. UBA689 TaxID=1947373 RepID=UPI0025D7E878|nr:hypothetical protein [Ralstonia sp. UBA689]
MLSKTATDALGECDYERIRTQLYQALRGDGSPLQDARVWQAGRHLPIPGGEGTDSVGARSGHHATA